MIEKKERDVLNSLARSLEFLQSLASDPAFPTLEFSGDGGIDDIFSKKQTVSHCYDSRVVPHTSEDSGSCEQRSVDRQMFSYKEDAGSPEEVMAALDAIIQTNGNPLTDSVPRTKGSSSEVYSTACGHRSTPALLQKQNLAGADQLSLSRFYATHPFSEVAVDARDDWQGWQVGGVAQESFSSDDCSQLRQGKQAQASHAREQRGISPPSRTAKHLRFSPETCQASMVSRGGLRRVSMERDQAIPRHATSSPSLPMHCTSPLFSDTIAPGRRRDIEHSSPFYYDRDVSFAAETRQHSDSSKKPQLHDDTMALQDMADLSLPHDSHNTWSYDLPLHGDEMDAIHGNTRDLPLSGNAQLRMSVDIMCAAVRNMAAGHIRIEDRDDAKDTSDTETHRYSMLFAS
jgi:hypothetical protein